MNFVIPYSEASIFNFAWRLSYASLLHGIYSNFITLKLWLPLAQGSTPNFHNSIFIRRNIIIWNISLVRSYVYLWMRDGISLCSITYLSILYLGVFLSFSYGQCYLLSKDCVALSCNLAFTILTLSLKIYLFLCFLLI